MNDERKRHRWRSQTNDEKQFSRCFPGKKKKKNSDKLPRVAAISFSRRVRIQFPNFPTARHAPRALQAKRRDFVVDLCCQPELVRSITILRKAICGKLRFRALRFIIYRITVKFERFPCRQNPRLFAVWFGHAGDFPINGKATMELPRALKRFEDTNTFLYVSSPTLFTIICLSASQISPSLVLTPALEIQFVYQNRIGGRYNSIAWSFFNIRWVADNKIHAHNRKGNTWLY